MSILTPKQWREQRQLLTPTELLSRCKSAARLEMRGQMFSTDDRLECAASIMADGVAELKGSMPREGDQRHSLNAYCGRAKNYRRSIQRQRDRDAADAERCADEQAWTLDALMPDYGVDVEPPSMETAARAAEHAMQRLDLDGENVFTLFYGYCRDLPGPVVADELTISANAYDVRCLRAKAVVRDAYPTAVEFLAALVGEPIRVDDPLTGETMLRFCLEDASSEAHNRTHCLHQPWREGTDAGSWPTRPETADAARAVCEVRQRRAAPKLAVENIRKATRGTSIEQVQADSLLRLSRALVAGRR
jgi:hypothetical protein